MKCDLCGQPLKNGQEVAGYQPFVMSEGQPRPDGAMEFSHEDCEEAAR